MNARFSRPKICTVCLLCFSFFKQEAPWNRGETHTLASLPALIHNGANYLPPEPITKKQQQPLQVDLSSSCTSTDINDMLQTYLGTRCIKYRHEFSLCKYDFTCYACTCMCTCTLSYTCISSFIIPGVHVVSCILYH